jgi:hypothetical protein
MAGNFREEFERVEERVIELHWQWKTYCCLFAQPSDNEAIFLETDPDAFCTIHWTFLQAICMALCRLGDPAGQADRSNLTLERLSVQASCSNLLNASRIRDLRLFQLVPQVATQSRSKAQSVGLAGTCG